MLVTVENQLATPINGPQVGEDGIAVGGGNHPEETTHRTNALPYPFGRYVGELEANGGADSIQLPMHEADFRQNSTVGLGSSQMARGLPVRDQWNQMVQAGVVTFTVADQTDDQDVEEAFILEI